MTTLFNHFYEALIADQRWMLIVNGLWSTVVITILSLFIGTLLGGLIYLMTLSHSKGLRQFAATYRYIVRGTPLLVLLLFFFYVILSGGNGIVAAVAAFAVNFSNLACALIQSSLDSVGVDQMEAGRALGFSKMQCLHYIVAPQALKNALPAYKFQAVSMVKSTSIVGYVAILDLAGATEAIRNDAQISFVPLLLVTIIYFILAWLLCKGLDFVVRKTTRL